MNNLAKVSSADIKTIDRTRFVLPKINVKKLLLCPYGATIFPIFVLLSALFFPPSLYKYYVNEPNYIFLNFLVVIYVLVCLVFYSLGVYISDFKLAYRLNLFKKKIGLSPFTYIGIVAIITIALQLLFIIIFNVYFAKTAGLSLFLVSLLGKGELVKVVSREISIPLGLGAIPTFILGFEFWLLYQLYKLGELEYQSRKQEKSLRILIWLSLFLNLLVNIITVNRPVLLVLIIGFYVIYAYFNKRGPLSGLVKLFFTIMIVFIVTSILRWAAGAKGEISYLLLSRYIGYLIAPYNRLALIIDGNLSYKLPKLFYLLPICKIPFINIVFYPSYSELNFLYAYPALASAGLNTSYNMTTLFGAMYETLGIAAPAYFAIWGIVGNRLFHSFKEGRTFGIVFYPLFYSSVALWIVDVNYFLMMFFYFFYAYLVLIIYNAMVKPKRCF